MKVNLGKYPKNGNRSIKVHIDHHDTWSLDHTLSVVILPALLQLKQNKQGIPNEFADVGGESYSTQQCFDFYTDSHDEAFDMGCKNWEETLDKMIWAFQQIALEDYEDKYRHGDTEFDFVESDYEYPNPITGVMEKTYQMVNKNTEYWYDNIGSRMHEDRIQEGLDLFAKYFRCLWE